MNNNRIGEEEKLKEKVTEKTEGKISKQKRGVREVVKFRWKEIKNLGRRKE